MNQAEFCIYMLMKIWKVNFFYLVVVDDRCIGRDRHCT